MFDFVRQEFWRQVNAPPRSYGYSWDPDARLYLYLKWQGEPVLMKESIDNIVETGPKSIAKFVRHFNDHHRESISFKLSDL